MKSKNKESGVSPVVGVMLMLVVTIIIAAVVGMVASNYVGSTEASPMTRINYLGSVQGNDFENGFLGEVGLLFENAGGENIVLTNLEITLQENTRGVVNETTITFNDAPSTAISGILTPGEARLSTTPSAKKVDYRMKKVGVTMSYGKRLAYQTIEPGDRFIIYADRIIQSDTSKYSQLYMVATRNGTYSEGFSENGPGTVYTLKDTSTGNVIASGDLSGKVYDYI